MTVCFCPRSTMGNSQRRMKTAALHERSAAFLRLGHRAAPRRALLPQPLLSGLFPPAENRLADGLHQVPWTKEGKRWCG